MTASVPNGLDEPRALQILSSEFASLQAARSMAASEAFSRAGMFLTAVSGSVVALALVAQATQFAATFAIAALIILPVVLFLGVATLVRLAQVNQEDLLTVQAMNRIRRAYLTLAPAVAPYVSTPIHDDIASIFASFAVRRDRHPAWHGLVTTPALVSVICAVVTGVIAALVVGLVGAGERVAIGAGIVGFLVAFLGLLRYAVITIGAFSDSLEVRFPPDVA